MELLLQKGASPGAAYNDNHTPLDLVARYGCHDRMAELFLEKGAPIEGMAADNKHTLLRRAVGRERSYQYGRATSSETCLDGS